MPAELKKWYREMFAMMTVIFVTVIISIAIVMR